MSWDNTAPTLNTLSGHTPDNTAPTGNTLAGTTPDNTAPGAQTLTGHTPDNTAPAGNTLSGVTRPLVAVAASVANCANLAAYALDDNPFDNGASDGVEGKTHAELIDKLFLLQDQTDAKQNGLYTYDGDGFTRSADTLAHGLRIGVAAGAVNKGKVFELTTADPIVPGTTELTFTEVAGAIFPAIPNTIT